MRKINCLVGILCLLLYSCSKDSEKTISSFEKNVEFSSIGGKQQIGIYTNTEWEVKYEVDWINAETFKNISNGSIIITVQSNNMTADRSSPIIVTTPSGEIIGKITISQKGRIDDSPFQVYNEDWTPFEGDIELICKPAVSEGSFDSPDHFPSSTISLENTWVINGEVKDGIMNIDFPTEKMELTSEYKNFTEGLTMAQMFIEQKNSFNRKIGLHKKGDKYYNSVYILYVEEDFTNELVTFKTGWNFIEIYYNPDWVYGSDEPFELIGIISQDVNTFLEKGYRWLIEIWI